MVGVGGESVVDNYRTSYGMFIRWGQGENSLAPPVALHSCLLACALAGPPAAPANESMVVRNFCCTPLAAGMHPENGHSLTALSPTP